MDYKIIYRINYSGKLHINELDKPLEFFTKNQLKSIYPNKNYIINGAIGNKSGSHTGVAEDMYGQLFPVYKEKTYSKLTEKIVGYVAIDEHNYLAVVKNTIFKRILVFILILMLLGGVVATATHYSEWFGKNGTIQTITKKPDIDKNAEDWKGATSSESKSGATSGISIPGFKSISLKANQIDQTVSFLNPEKNTCYFVISLILPDGTEIYKSKMIPPSKGIYKIELNQKLNVGTYNKAILKYECFKMDNNLTKLNGANVQVILEVK